MTSQCSLFLSNIFSYDSFLWTAVLASRSTLYKMFIVTKSVFFNAYSFGVGDKLYLVIGRFTYKLAWESCAEQNQRCRLHCFPSLAASAQGLLNMQRKTAKVLWSKGKKWLTKQCYFKGTNGIISPKKTKKTEEFMMS